MSTTPPLEEQIALAGVRYGRRHDISYRIGLVLQVLGAAVLAVLYPLEDPFYTIGIMIFEAGALLSAIYMLVWMRWFRKIILSSIVTGIALQVAGFYAPEQHAASVIIAGIGFVTAGSAGIIGKEAYCYGYREGRLLLWLYPVAVLANLFWNVGLVANTLAFSALFILLLFLVGKKLKQPLIAPCEKNDCGRPQKE